MTNFTLSDLPQEFIELLDRTKMKFTEPNGFKRTNPIENTQMNYELAYKHPNKRFEVRYAIRPMDLLLKEYNDRESNKKKVILISIQTNGTKMYLKPQSLIFQVDNFLIIQYLIKKP